MIAAFECVFSFCVKHMFQLPCLKQTIIEQIAEKALLCRLSLKGSKPFYFGLVRQNKTFRPSKIRE
jgi:hypothetical protein